MERKDLYEILDKELDDEILEENYEDNEEKEAFKIRDNALASWAMRKLKVLEDEFLEKENIAKNEISRIEKWLLDEKNKTEKKKFFFNNRLEEYVRYLMATSDESKVETPYGTAKIGKQQPEWQYDEDIILKFLESENMIDYITIKKSLNKKELRKLNRVGEEVVNENGEVIPGIKVVERPDVLRLKLLDWYRKRQANY